MSNLGSTSSDLLIGKMFLKKLLYVQHVDEEKDTVSEIPERYLEEFLKVDFHDSNFPEYLKSPNENLSILKSSIGDWIKKVTIYSNPLPIPLQLPGVTFHAFVVFQTWNDSFSNSSMWWSIEKNGTYIVLQQSPNKDDVINKIYDTEKKTSVERLGPVREIKSGRTYDYVIYDLMRIIVHANMLNERYHLLFSNCQHFASFVFKKLCYRYISDIIWSIMCARAESKVDRIGLRKKKIQIKNKVDAFKYKTIVNDEKFDCYWAMMEERRKDFEKLIKEMTIESLNSVDSQGYTLLEWATVFSTSHWPIDEELKKKGAQIPLNEGSFRRNVFFIALQYLHSNTKSKLFDSFDGIDIINGVNKTGDTALHLALYGEKWKIVKEILNQFEDFDVNRTNSVGDTPLHLAARLKCEFGLFKKIVNRTDSENVNKTDTTGNTALHYAIVQESETKVEELLKRDDVNFNIKSNKKETTLHLASNYWKEIPVDLFKIILEKSNDVNAQDDEGWTALHFAISRECKIATMALLAHSDVDVKVKNNNNQTALHFACFWWKDIPVDLFNLILEKSTDVNAQTEYGNTPLHLAIRTKSETETKALLTHEDVDVNIKNNNKETALHLASKWPNIPGNLFKLIIEKSTSDIINTQDKNGETALHLAIREKFEIATKELLAHKDVNVNVKNNDNQTVILLDCSFWKDIPGNLFKLIIEKSTSDIINTQDKNGETALHLAIREKSEIATKELLGRDDVDVNVKNNDKETALHLACFWKDIPGDLFKIILDKSTDINAQDKDGETALHYAIWNKSKTVVKELLNHKDVNVNVTCNFRNTPLHKASSWWDIPVDLFNLILEKSTYVINSQNKKGDTALHVAIFCESEIATKEFLKHKDVNVNIKNNEGFTTEKYFVHLARKRLILRKRR